MGSKRPWVRWGQSGELGPWHRRHQWGQDAGKEDAWGEGNTEKDAPRWGCWELCPRANHHPVDGCTHFVIIYELFNNKGHLTYSLQSFVYLLE